LFDLQDGGRAPSWILNISNVFWLTGSGGPLHIAVPNFVQIGQSVADISDFSIFQDGGCLLSWICLAPIWTVYDDYFVVFIFSKFGFNQHSIFDNMKVSIFGAFRMEKCIHAPQIGVLEEFYPISGEQCQRNAKSHILVRVRVV